MGESRISENAGFVLILFAVIIFIAPIVIPFFVDVGNVAGSSGLINTNNLYVRFYSVAIATSGFLFFIGIIPFYENEEEIRH